MFACLSREIIITICAAITSSFSSLICFLCIFPFTGEEPSYAGVPMSTIVEEGYGVGDVLSLLWFKRSLPRYCTQFIEVGIRDSPASLVDIY